VSEGSEKRGLPTWVYVAIISLLAAFVSVLGGAIITLSKDKLDGIQKASESSLSAVQALQLDFADYRADHKGYGDRISAIEDWIRKFEDGREERLKLWDEKMVQYDQCKAKKKP
jgi:hypothetical protein